MPLEGPSPNARIQLGCRTSPTYTFHSELELHKISEGTGVQDRSQAKQMACAIGGRGNACRHHRLRSRGSCISARASAKDVMTVLGKRGDEGLVELGEEYFKTWEKLVASSSSAPSGPDPGSTNAMQPPVPNTGSSTTNPDPLTDPSSCPSEDGLQAWGNCFVKVADSLLDFANWLGRPYGYDSHEDIDKYGVCVPLLDLGPPELVLYGTLTKARVPHSSYPEPQSYPGYSKPWRDKESAPLVEIPVSEGPPGGEAVGEGDSDADEEEEESVEEGHKLPNRTAFGVHLVGLWWH